MLKQSLEHVGEEELPTSVRHRHGVNVGLEARRLIADQPIDVLLGGYHLAGGAMEDRIDPTVRDLTELVAPRIVAPGHCTGWRAASALATAFGPSAFAPCVVGSRFVLTAQSSVVAPDLTSPDQVARHG